MNLIIDTSTNMQYVALANETDIVDFIWHESINSHAETITQNIETIMQRNELKYNELEQIIVVNGPGSFTGVRIGLTCAKTIALLFKMPILTISTLELLALSNPNKTKLSIRANRLNCYNITYKFENEKLITINQSFEKIKDQEIAQLNLNYDLILKHWYLLAKTNYLEATPNYVQTPNFVKKLAKDEDKNVI